MALTVVRRGLSPVVHGVLWRSTRAWVLAVAAALGGGLLLSAPGTALAQTGYSVTFAARWCENYSDIYANRSRDNVVESLKPLGADSPYGPDFNIFPQVSPSVEDAGSQALAPNGPCHPLVGWRFTMGMAKIPLAVPGAWGLLSRLTDTPCAAGCTNAAGEPIDTWPVPTPIFSTNIVTQASTPLLDENGDPIGARTLPGAVTIPLDEEQVKAAEMDVACGPWVPGAYPHLPNNDTCADGLWMQGGTPDDPVLARQFGGVDTPEYGFATLRCSVDNKFGDNTEIIGFPGNDRHVFCFGYYVKPGPTGGEITIKKQVGPNGTPPATFPFQGSVSYLPGGAFSLAAGDSINFHRAGGQTWTAREVTNPDGSVGDTGYHLASIHCDAVTGAGTPGQSRVSISAQTAAIHLVAGEHVTCTFTNEYGAPPGGLRITKITNGGVGTFHYTVTPVGRRGSRDSVTARAETFEQGVPVDAQPAAPLTQLEGPYEIREQLPRSPDGRWRLTSVVCNGNGTNGTRKPTNGPVMVTLSATQGTVCTFTNRFIPRGSISIGKITRGATGTTNFVVSSQRASEQDRRQIATTRAEGVEARAKPDAFGLDRTDRLRLGQYRILEEGPLGAGWSLTGVTCNGVQVPFSQGAIFVKLTRSQPRLHCVFTNTFSHKPPPEPPPDTGPGVPGGGPGEQGPLQPAQQLADLSVSKHASTQVASRGHTVTFRITVTNHGPDRASRVVLHDQLFGSSRLIGVHTTAGRCSARLPLVCQLGTVRAGASVHVTVRLRVTGRARFTDRAVVGTAATDLNLRNNVASVAVRLVSPRTPPPPRVTG